MRKLLILLLFALLLTGCYRSTGIILPPETTDASQSLPEPVTDATVSDPLTLETTASTSAPPEETVPKPTSGKAESNPPKKPPKATTPPSSEEATAPQPDTQPPGAEETVSATSVTVPEQTQAPTQPRDPIYDISGHNVGSTEKKILEEINRVRSEAGLGQLSLDRKLSALAAIRAYECSLKFSATRPDGRSWRSVLSDYGYSRSVSEESRLHSSASYSADILVEGWMVSASSSAKLLNPEVSTVGIGCYKSSNGTLYAVALLAK